MSKIILTLLACVVVACAEELHLDQETNSFVAANISKTQAIKTDKTWIEDEDDKILVKNIKENVPKDQSKNFFENPNQEGSKSYKNFHELKKRSLKQTKKTKHTSIPLAEQTWSSCNATKCGEEGSQYRTKQCRKRNTTSPVDERGCKTIVKEYRPCMKICNLTNTNNTLSWSQWTDWSSCSQTCGRGNRLRRRNCDGSTRGSCGGPSEETQYCFSLCNWWAEWGEWGSCSKSCVTGGLQRRQRPCKTNGINLVIDEDAMIIETSLRRHRERYNRILNSSLCPGGLNSSVETRPCVGEVKCQRQWTKWSNWSACSTTCGIGYEEMTRSCVGDESDGLECGGQPVKFRRCYAPPCWTPWSSFSKCPTSCTKRGRYRRRRRQCIGTSQVKKDYLSCSGRSFQSQRCPMQDCAEWGSWSRFSQCSQTCGRGVRRRTRRCLGRKCRGKNYQEFSCSRRPCPSWSPWATYTCCSATCGSNGFKQRRRVCRNSRGRRNACVGRSRERVRCDLHPCNERPPTVFNTFTCGIPKQTNGTNMFRIYGGWQAPENRWPWQGSWQRKICSFCHWVHVCGSTLITPKWLVTATHCVKETKIPLNYNKPQDGWSVVLGGHRLYEDGDRHFVDRVIPHPSYDNTIVTTADIALLKLRRPATLSSKINPACLPNINRPRPQSVCYISGWGRSKSTRTSRSKLARVLQEARIPILTFSSCQKLGWSYRTYLKRRYHMCAGNAKYADTCTGDSGGPLSCRSRRGKWFLAGITSFGFTTCGRQGHTGIYVPINNFQWWIRRTIDRIELGGC